MYVYTPYIRLMLQLSLPLECAVKHDIFTFILSGVEHQQGMQSLSLRNCKPGINDTL